MKFTSAALAVSLLMDVCLGKARIGVVKTGSTVGPDFVLKTGIASVGCPNSHPYAFNAGNHCCNKIFHPSTPEKDLDLYAPIEDCPAHDYIPCPHKKAKCKSLQNAEETDSCPDAHPFPLAKGAYCCSTVQKISGGILSTSDQHTQCASENRISCPGLPELRCKFGKAPDKACPKDYLYAFSEGCCASNATADSSACGPILTMGHPKECCANPLLVPTCKKKLEICKTTDPCTFDTSWRVENSLSSSPYTGTTYLLSTLTVDHTPDCDVAGSFTLFPDKAGNQAVVFDSPCAQTASTPQQYHIESIFIRNTRNNVYMDRAAKNMDIYISEDYSGTYEKVASFTFPDARQLPCDDPQQEKTVQIGRLAARVKIVMVDYHGRGGGLEYVQVNTN